MEDSFKRAINRALQDQVFDSSEVGLQRHYAIRVFVSRGLCATTDGETHISMQSRPKIVT